MYLINDNRFADKSITEIFALMPKSTMYQITYISCADKSKLQALGFSQYSMMRLTKADEWQEQVEIVGMRGAKVGFWMGNKNSADIASEIRII